ncbi:DUF6058 family natural product biosynthesis protein [Stenotrophomonas sp.]|uniref:DUF6058 family natural product biosynthesis protein n=1 Tax=Stenotrophomonas sp. TaxID=69392 RepID=UPI002FC9BD49
MTLENYLRHHFVDKPTLAAQTGIPVDALEALVAEGALPAPTYVCGEGVITSAAFGPIAIPERLAGEYFRPEYARWIQIARQAPPGHAREVVIGTLTDELRDALRTWFDTAEDVERRVVAYLPHFDSGTFGLCVADPATGAGIVRKEVLQERLVALTDNGNDATPPGIARDALLQLIDDYAAAAMPFSPAEYERSSRKRLVEALRPRVASEG